jgi:hypothetical protein
MRGRQVGGDNALEDAMDNQLAVASTADIIAKDRELQIWAH